MEYNSFEVGQAIRAQRIKCHKTIEELAFEVNRSKYHMNLIELGTRKMGMELLFELITVLHTDANSVLGISAGNGNTLNVSIDNRLKQLNPEQQKYYTKMFMYMLDNKPV